MQREYQMPERHSEFRRQSRITRQEPADFYIFHQGVPCQAEQSLQWQSEFSGNMLRCTPGMPATA